MKLRTTLNGVSYSFRDINDVLAKANEHLDKLRFVGWYLLEVNRGKATTDFHIVTQ